MHSADSIEICELHLIQFSELSQLEPIKNDHRTALKHESLLALMQTKHFFKNKGSHQAASFIPPKEMVALNRRM